MQIAYCQLDYETTPGEADNDEILREEIKKAMIALESAYCGFDNATDPDLIDCYIYQVNSALKRYRYLLLQAEKIHNVADEEQKDPSLPKTIFIPETPAAYT
ncbi:MAG: YaaL family protein [Lachnospiraceae bacterium]|nr:YaaL family protein [Lachnospiraceae bacterium]MBQ7832766.1 YaaL family protein [Lachnospiraceae bacterium]